MLIANLVSTTALCNSCPKCSGLAQGGLILDAGDSIYRHGRAMS